MNEQKAPNGIEWTRIVNSDGSVRFLNELESLQWWSTWSPEMAYALGFIYADGSVRDKRNDVAIVQKDHDILHQLHDVLPGFNKRIVPTGRPPAKSLKLRVTGLRVVLAQYGIVPRKTYEGFWPPAMPFEYSQHYIRGFFDGDGYVIARERADSNTKRWVVGFTCNLQDYIKQLIRHLVLHGLSEASMYIDRGYAKVKWHSRADILKFHNLFYSDTTLFVRSKKLEFDRAVEYINATPEYTGANRIRLTHEQIRDIRILYKRGGWSFVTLGRNFGVGKTTIENVLKRRGAYGEIE